MRLRSLTRFALAGICLLAACDSGPSGPDDGDDGNGGGNGTSRMTATIDGQAWQAETTEGSVSAIQSQPITGGYLISGIELGAGGSLTTTLSFVINGIVGPGTYPLGVDGVTVFGGFAGITLGSGANWTTPISGAAGSITITELTTAHIKGTFTFTARATANSGATGTKTITNGTFDAPMLGTAVLPAAVPDSVGSKITATLNGESWNAAIASGQTTVTHLAISGINERQTLIITIPKPTATGTFQLGNNTGNILLAWDPNAVAPAGARCCYGIAGDVGTITFTTLTTRRTKGTFSATLRAQPGTAASGTLVITNGTFDLGMYHTP